MLRVCAWCRRVLEDGPPPASHTACRPCMVKAALKDRLIPEAEAAGFFMRFWAGGEANRRKVDYVDVDPEELKKGVRHEQEHTPDREVAERIALDHLAEHPRYYTVLERAFGR